MHNPSNTPSMQRADAHAMPEHAMPDAQAMPNDARGRDRELPTNSPSTPTSATSTREDVDGGRMAIDLEHLRTALNRLSDTLDPKEGPVILAWSVDRLAEALATELAELSRPVGPGVARVPVDEPDPGWVERLRGTVVDEARRVAVTSTPEAATETCEQPVWDGPYWMQCGRLIVNGWCGRHGADWRYSSPPAPSGLQRATEQPDPLDICAQCGFWRMAHDRNTHIFAGAAVDPTTHLMVLVDGDDCCVLSVHWGNGNSDPVWYVDVTLSGTQLGRWICRAYWPVRHRLDRRKART